MEKEFASHCVSFKFVMNLLALRDLPELHKEQSKKISISSCSTMTQLYSGFNKTTNNILKDRFNKAPCPDD